MKHVRLFVVLTVLAVLAPAARSATLPEAARAADDSLVTALLAGGADVDAADPEHYGATALMIAAGNGDVALVRRLLDAGANVDLGDANGDTALNWAAYSGQVEAARLLLDAGADPNLAGHGNALQIAIRRGHEELVQILSLAMEARRTPGGRDMMLMVAVYRDDPAAVGVALETGASPDAHDDVDRPLLHVAARLGHRRALQALLTGGASVDATDLNGFTALMVAARERHADIVGDLLDAGADVNHRADAQGLKLTPLHLAAIGGDPAIVRTLVTAGADPDAADTDGAVPALWGILEGNVDCTVALLDLGADPTLEHKDGDSVASLARRYEIAPVLAAIARQR
ncbi:MAG: ankyrin repeat domain-containing protein [Candidatus Krumholzibacteriia bacterium]